MRTDTGKIQLSRHRMTDTECKLVFYLIKQMLADGGSLDKYRYSVEKLLKVTGLTEFSSRSLFQMMTNLFQKIIHVNESGGWTRYHWFDTLKYDSADDVLIVRFNKEVKPHLLMLREDFNIIDFKAMNARGVFPWNGTDDGTSGAEITVAASA